MNVGLPRPLRAGDREVESAIFKAPVEVIVALKSEVGPSNPKSPLALALKLGLANTSVSPTAAGSLNCPPFGVSDMRVKLKLVPNSSV